MTKSVSTNFGEPLSTESKKLVHEVRLKINQTIHPNVSSVYLLQYQLKYDAVKCIKIFFTTLKRSILMNKYETNN